MFADVGVMAIRYLDSIKLTIGGRKCSFKDREEVKKLAKFIESEIHQLQKEELLSVISIV
jgi:hypothetical protein